ncbi:B box and SPRY domain-containing protein [Acipenser ruthenus]|uniref:B box and SPRY domain-containing protein n=1 Tax=Acipenser ruthenus TaxID=7906 RepID=UPI0027421B8A|nr:B box and SPRY domain-containing protein [Acipenser ruthenus]
MTSDLNDSDLIPVSLHGNDVEPLPAAAVSDGGKSTCHPGEGESQAGEKAPAAAAGTLHAPGDEETRGEPDRNQPPDHSANCSSDMKGDRSIALQQKDGAQNSDKEDTGSGSGDRCADHESQLDWYCSTEDRLICSHCAATGTCKSHTVTPVFKKAADMRNKLVDACEKLQLRAVGVERFMAETLLVKKQAALGSAAAARETLVQRFNLIREACESEEQRLLEVVHGEEERTQQAILTQRVHWAESLKHISAARGHLVQMLTERDDLQLVNSTQEILERVEDAHSILEPQDSGKLNFNSSCVQSPLLLGMWATAALVCRAAPADLTFNGRTVSPLLGLSEDGRTLRFLPKRARQPCEYSPERFDKWPNALAGRSFSSGTHSWLVGVRGSGAFKLGVSSGRIERKGQGSEARLGYNPHSWVLSHYEGDFSFSHAGRHHSLSLLRGPSTIGVLLDCQAGQLLFFDPESCSVLYSHHASFTEPLYPAFAVADSSITLLSH